MNIAHLYKDMKAREFKEENSDVLKHIDITKEVVLATLKHKVG